MTTRLLIASALMALSCFGFVRIGLLIDRSVKAGRMDLYAFSTSMLMFATIFLGMLTGGGALGFGILFLGTLL